VTTSENFISRWARLKRKRTTEVVEDPLRPAAAEVSVGGAEATIAQPRLDSAADEAFDPASLPSIDAITFNTDIRGFLQSRVPAELTRAALRQAWASDPAIRDFIGIAENQWDFNDPNAMHGFGPLPETENVPARLAQALGRHDKLAEMIPEMPVSVEQPLPAVTDHEPADLGRSVQRTFDGSPSTSNIRGLPEDSRGEAAAAKKDGVAEEDNSPQSHRSHGSALPR
jgi:hypothetical protein